jgi:hypothetical protein
MNNPPPAVCGRPTLRGGPCQRPLQWYETACVAHQSPAEAETAYRTLRDAERTGRRA